MIVSVLAVAGGAVGGDDLAAVPPSLVLTAQMLNSPLATAGLVVQVTGRLAP